jgi:DNA-binding winged helix-turn-helix (wHTH) protein/TolB-like protein
MAKQINHFYEFGSVRLDATNRLLYKNGAQLSVQPRVIETLLVLVKNPHVIIDKETILDVVWPGVAVEEGGLKRNISVLRKALGEEGRYIETLPKRGYRFTAEVRENWEEIPAYTVESAASELLVQRRASLRITQEEEVSDSADSHADVYQPKTTHRARAPQIRTMSRRMLTTFAGTTALVLASVGVWWATSNPEAAGPAPVKSIAVLPFKSLASHSDDEHLSIGLADALITRLSTIKGLSVRPTSAIIKFKDKEQDSVAAGQMFGVDAVLEGSIYRTNDRMRIMTRLLRVKDQSAIWAGQFDEKADGLLSIQNAIANQIVSSLALNLSSSEKDALAKRHTESPDAYQLYLTGRYHWNKRNKDAGAKAESFFLQAIEKDPGFALAYLGLSDTLIMGGVYEESLSAIKKALELDDQLGEAYASRGFWKMFKGWQWDEAEADFKHSVDLNPGYGTTHQWYATLLAIRGRVEEAKSEMRKALEIDPMSHNFVADLGQMHYFAGQYDEAESYCRKALEIYPDFLNARIYLSDILLKAGDENRAFDEDMKAAQLHLATSKGPPDRIAEGIAFARELYRQSGYKGYWRSVVERLLNRTADGFSYYALVRGYALLGEKEKALDALEKSYENRDFMLPFVNVDPLYDTLRSEPRFKAVFRRMGLLQ